MHPEEIKAAIADLEVQLSRYRVLLDKSFEANEEFRKTKEIYHQMRLITDKLEVLNSQISSGSE